VGEEYERDVFVALAERGDECTVKRAAVNVTVLTFRDHALDDVDVTVDGGEGDGGDVGDAVYGPLAAGGELGAGAGETETVACFGATDEVCTEVGIEGDVHIG
jgi:hypothetical protein